MKIRCLIIDDEPFAIELIERHLIQFPDFCVVGKCRNIVEAVKALQLQQVDLVFLDVHMPEIDGITFLSEIKNPPPVILTTAYREYALQAFEIGVIDYLLKPISLLRFAKSLERYKSFYIEKTNSNNETKAVEQKPLLFKSGNEFQKIEADDILYIQSQKDYVNIITKNKKILVRASMKNIILQLPEKQFLQIHKSYIIPIRSITGVSANYVILGPLKVPIGRSYKVLLKSHFDKK